MKAADTTSKIEYLTDNITCIIVLLNSGQSQAIPGPTDAVNPDRLSDKSLIQSTEPQFLPLRKSGFDPVKFTGSGLRQGCPQQSVTYRMKENSKGEAVVVDQVRPNGSCHHRLGIMHPRVWFTRNQFKKA